MRKTTRKLVIVGAGHVGSAVLNCALNFDLADEIAIIDIINKKAHGEALDSCHALPFPYNTNVNIHEGVEADYKDADLIIIAAGPSIMPGENLDRLTLAARNVEVINDVMSKITKQTREAIVIMITNPLDITTYYAATSFGYPKDRLFGTGTTLETARLKQILASKYQVDPKDVHGYMLGEHGNSAFPTWSLTNIAGIGVEQLDEFFQPATPLDKEAIAPAVVNVAYDVLMSKGWTNSGIAMGACRLAKAVLWNERCIMPVSTVLEGEYGLSNVALSIPCIIGANGVERRLEMKLTEQEVEKLHNSANCIRAVLKSVNLIKE